MKKLRFKRLTGYLTGDYQSKFNDSKQAEVKDRVKHVGAEQCSI